MAVELEIGAYSRWPVDQRGMISNTWINEQERREGQRRKEGRKEGDDRTNNDRRTLATTFDSSNTTTATTATTTTLYTTTMIAYKSISKSVSQSVIVRCSFVSWYEASSLPLKSITATYTTFTLYIISSTLNILDLNGGRTLHGAGRTHTHTQHTLYETRESHIKQNFRVCHSF